MLIIEWDKIIGNDGAKNVEIALSFIGFYFEIWKMKGMTNCVNNY